MATDFIEHMSAVVGVCLENQLNFEALTRNSLIDSLTGVNNRHFLEQRLDDAITRAHSTIEPLSCFYLGIDDFQQLNDDYGRAVGDQGLIAVATAIRAQLGNNDILVRYTGETFIMLLANTDQAQAQEIAQSIRQVVKEIQFSAADSLVSLTISIGIAIYKTSGSTQLKPAKVKVNLLGKAGKALDKARAEGTDRVILSGIITDPISLANLFKRY